MFTNSSILQSLDKIEESELNSKDLINKKYKACGCIIILELDIIQNILNERYIQYCNTHYQQTQSITNIISNKVFDYQSNLNNNIIINESYLNFGKYKNKTFNYVFQTDKLYCYNLAFWNNKHYIYKHININEFIQYIQDQITI